MRQATSKPTVLEGVRKIMLDCQWRTPFEIREILASRGLFATDSTITARLRDLRKKEHGGLLIESKRFRKGVHGYRVTPNAKATN